MIVKAIPKARATGELEYGERQKTTRMKKRAFRKMSELNVGCIICVILKDKLRVFVIHNSIMFSS